MHDVVVVGGGPAGCALALLLARRGYGVLVLERDPTGRDTSSTHRLSPAAVLLLERWGLLSQLVATGCPAADGTTIWADVDRLELPNPRESPVTYAPRTRLLVALLATAGAAAGVHLRRGFTAKDLVWEGGRVSGVVATGTDGHSVYERARIVVGADGRNSLVAQVAGAETYDERPATSCCYYAYWRGAAGPAPEIFLGRRRAVGVYPTDGGLAWVVVVRPVTEWADFKRAPEQTYLAQIELFPALARRLRSATRESRLSGTAELGSSLRRPGGAGWALLGDAGHPRDGSLCLGLRDVCTEAGVLAAAIDDGLAGRRPLSASLTRYGEWRDTGARQAEDATSALRAHDWTVDDVTDAVARARDLQLREVAGLVSP